MRIVSFFLFKFFPNCQLNLFSDVFSKLSHNGGPVSNHWQYVRRVTKGWAYSPTSGYIGDYVPYYDVYDDNIRCGRGAAISGTGVQALVVNAGDELAFYAYQDSTAPEETVGIYHEGPGQAYLSKATGDLESYTGNGDWFKIGYLGQANSTTWKTYKQRSVRRLLAGYPQITCTSI
jgi:hypothetical protein